MNTSAHHITAAIGPAVSSAFIGRMAEGTIRLSGSNVVFITAACVAARGGGAWGHCFITAETWQLVINTSTIIITF